MKELIRAVEYMLDLPEGCIEGPSHREKYLGARALVASVLREHGVSLPDIGRRLGGRHHTSIMSLIPRFAYYAARNPNLAETKALFNPDEPLVLSVRHAREQWVRNRNAAVIRDIRRKQPAIRIMKRHRVSITAFEQLKAQVRAGLVA